MFSQNSVIFILAKSPIPKKGRFGSEKFQDWYKMCLIAADLLKLIPHSEILVVTDFKIPGEGREDSYYITTLLSKGVPASKIVVIPKGIETVVQLHQAHQFARETNRELIIVHAPIHTMRLRYLCWKDKISATFLSPWFSIPRPKDVIVDMILVFLFPILDVLGLRTWFLRKLEARRRSGKL